MDLLDTRLTSPEQIAKFIDKPLLQDSAEIEQAVRDIVLAVRERGDSAVFEYVKKFDWPGADSLQVGEESIEQAYSNISDDLLSAIRSAKINIRRFHEKQLRASWIDYEKQGKILGQMIRPLEKVGVLVPGAQAPLPSSVLMGAIPAKTAGVKEVYVSTPPQRDGSVHPAILVAAAESGVEGVYRIGGAHGVAALAYGTETVPKVDKIVGPGNAYVTMAKRLVFGQVGIDMLAGPSEVLVLADDTADARFVAADLLSQAEHAPDARPILITISEDLADQVISELEKQLQSLSRWETAAKSLEENGAIILVHSLEEGINLVNRAAPEHLEIMTADPMITLGAVKNAGAVFLGSYTAESLGDYIAGPNHTLPTGGTARFSSPLSTDDFFKKTNILMYSKEELCADALATEVLALAEGLDAHANAVKIRKSSAYAERTHPE